MGEVGRISGLMELLVGCMLCSVLEVYLDWEVKKLNSGLGLKVILGGFLSVSGPFTPKIYCAKLPKIA